MSYTIPPTGTYRRIRDGAVVEVVGCTGNTSFTDTVAVQGDRLTHVRLENFWKKYEPAHTEEASSTVPDLAAALRASIERARASRSMRPGPGLTTEPANTEENQP